MCCAMRALARSWQPEQGANETERRWIGASAFPTVLSRHCRTVPVAELRHGDSQVCVIPQVRDALTGGRH